MKCFVFLWRTWSALYCSYLECLYLRNTSCKRHCFDTCGQESRPTVKPTNISLIWSFWFHFYLTAQQEYPSPEVNANFASRLMFTWFSTLMLKGWKKPLEPGNKIIFEFVQSIVQQKQPSNQNIFSDDLYDLKPSDSAKQINSIWEKNWADQHRSYHPRQSHTNEKCSIVIPLIKSFGGLFAFSSAIRLINILIQVVRHSNLKESMFHYKRFEVSLFCRVYQCSWSWW